MQLLQTILRYDKKTTETAYQEMLRLGIPLSTEAPTWMLGSGSSSHPGMLPEEFITILLALVHAPNATIICETAKGGLAKNFLELPWTRTDGLHAGEMLAAQYFPGEVASSKKRIICEAFLKLMGYFDLVDDRLKMLKFQSMEKAYRDVLLSQVVCPELELKQIGSLPAFGALRQRDGVIVDENSTTWGNTTIGTLILDHGFLCNGLAAFKLNALVADPNTGIALRDYSASRGTLEALSGIWPNQCIALTTRLYCGWSLNELISFVNKKPEQFARILQAIPLWSNGTEYQIKK